MSRPQNEILDDIILASGGTITSQTRNGKLRDWLDAVSQPTTRQAPNFNGVSQYGDVNIPVFNGDLVRFNFIAEFSAYLDFQVFIGTNTRDVVWKRSNGTFGIRGSCLLDGVPIQDGVTPVPDDSERHEFTLTSDSSDTLRYIAKGFRVDTGYMDCPIFNLKVNDGSVYNYPMDDGWANNPVMRNTGKPLGADVKSDPSSLGQGWSEVSPNNYQIGGTNTGPSNVTFSGILDLNSRYLIEFRIYDYVSGLMRFNSPTGNSDFFSGDGAYKALFDSGISGTISIQAFDANSEFKVEVISIRLAEGYGEFINMTEAAWVEIPA